MVNADLEMITQSVTSLVRACAASSIAAFDKTAAHKVVVREWPSDNGAEWFVRSATLPTDTINAPALLRTVTSELVSTLSAQSVAARLFKEGLQLNFDKASQVSVPTLLGDSTYAVFVKDGDPIPVMQGHVEPLVLLQPRKLAAIVVMTAEMIRSSNIEALMLDALTRSIGLALDKILLDAQPEDDTRPAGMRYGVAASAASTAPEPVAALMSDIETLVRAVAAVSSTSPILVASMTRALMAELRSTHGLAPLRMLGSMALSGSMIVMAMAPNNLASVLTGVPTIAASMHPALQMDVPVIGDPMMRSMWQTDCVAILVRLPVAWAVRSQAGIAWMVTTNW